MTHDRLRRARDDAGAGLVEYALLLALICIVCLSALTLLGGNNEEGITGAASEISSAIN